MAVLKSFRDKSPVIPAAQPNIILVSDDSDDSSEKGTDYDYGVATGANMDDSSADEVNDDEISDDAAEDGDGSSSRMSDDHTGAGNDVHAGDDASAVGDASKCETKNGHDTADATAREDTPIEGALDANVHYEPDGSDTADGVANNDAIPVDEASNADSNDEIDAAEVTVDAADGDEGVAVELAAIRCWLDRLEAKLNPSFDVYQATSPRGKRKQTVAATPHPKRQTEFREVNTPSSGGPQKASSRVKRKRNAPSTPSSKRQRKDLEVNLVATRVWIQSEDEAESWEYTWRRGRGGCGGCWMRDSGAGTREEVDGEFLLSFSSNLAIEVRANADWLPLVMRWNGEAEVFEGIDDIDGRRLEVDDQVMVDMMCGGVRQHTGLLCRSRGR